MIKDFFSTRRSTKIKHMAEPGPRGEELQDILTLAARVPDHKKLVPFRFIVFDGEARAAFGAQLKTIFHRENPEATPQQLEFEQQRFLRAPTVIAVISSVREHKDVPYWEQILCAGACCFNLCFAANAYGYGTNWVTEWYSYHPEINTLLDVKDGETIAGFIYIGSATETNADRDRPNIESITQFYKGAV